MIRVNNKVFIAMVVMLIVLMTLVTACGEDNADTPQADETDSPAETPPEQGEAGEAEEPSGGDESAGDCPGATSVQVSSTNGAYQSREPIDWNNLGTQEAYVDSSTGTTTVNIYIANFTTSESLKGYKPDDGEAVLHFALRIRGEGNEVPVEMGEYNLKDYDSSDLHVTPKILLSGGSSLQISTHDINSSEFFVTGLSDTLICGTFAVDEKWTEMSGAFVVPIVN